jgi:hypothetical protein
MGTIGLELTLIVAGEGTLRLGLYTLLWEHHYLALLPIITRSRLGV